MEQINKSNKCCATCVYWLGSRQPNRLGFVEVESRMSKGKCGAKGLNESRTYQAVYSCLKWCKWSVLK